MDHFANDGTLYPEADGHFARVGLGHVLHFINVPNEEDISSVIKKMSSIFQSTKAAESLISFDMAISESFRVFEEGWKGAVNEGRAINVQF